MQLKRLWDTEGKKIVFAEGPSGHMCQVWTDETGDHLYIYDMAQWLSYNGTSPAGMEYDRSNWVELVDQEVGFYDTNEPTDLYAWDSGDKVSYKFVDWDGTVLKSGVLEEGETPTAPADPTRAATAQYTYTFAGWNPTVGPISKKTTFTATYTATVNEYTITWVDGDGNTLDTDTVAYGDTPEYTGSTPTKTATAQYTYTWDEGWTPSVVAVTGDATYTATFTATVNQYTVTIQSNNTDYGTVDESSVTVDYGTAISTSDNVLTIGDTEITATAETGYEFSSWGTLPATVTETLTITATFQAEGPVTEVLYTNPDGKGEIIHDLTNGDIIINYTGTEEYPSQIIIQDKDLGATEYLGETPNNQALALGLGYKWGATVAGDAGVAEAEDWSRGIQTVAPNGYHIPNETEWEDVCSILGDFGINSGSDEDLAYILLVGTGEYYNVIFEWTTTHADGQDHGYMTLIEDGGLGVWYGADSSDTNRVRCFKDPQL